MKVERLVSLGLPKPPTRPVLYLVTSYAAARDFGARRMHYTICSNLLTLAIRRLSSGCQAALRSSSPRHQVPPVADRCAPTRIRHTAHPTTTAQPTDRWPQGHTWSTLSAGNAPVELRLKVHFGGRSFPLRAHTVVSILITRMIAAQDSSPVRNHRRPTWAGDLAAKTTGAELSLDNSGPPASIAVVERGAGWTWTRPRIEVHYGCEESTPKPSCCPLLLQPSSPTSPQLSPASTTSSSALSTC